MRADAAAASIESRAPSAESPVSNPKSRNPQIPKSPNPSSAFTLTELLVTITIIGILSGLVLGALSASREAAAAYATKATIAKLNNIIMERYESYMTRRVPVNTTGMSPQQAAVARLAAIRLLMRLEMPDFLSDISDVNAPLLRNIDGSLILDSNNNQITVQSALWLTYHQRYTNNPPNPSELALENAKCLYLLISVGNPEAMEQFNQSEIGVSADGWPYFVDGWGRPIFWLRWAPGFSSESTPSAPSDIQTGNPTDDHDPFDTRNIDTWAGIGNPIRGFRLIPLIYSPGPDGEYAISTGTETHVYSYNGDPYWHYDDAGLTMYLGSPVTTGDHANQYHDNITNHHIEQR